MSAFAVGVAPAAAATIQVQTKKDEFGAGGTGKCALREAVQAANTDAKFGGCKKGKGGDVIALGKGVYKLSIEVDNSTEDANEEGDLDTNSPIKIRGKGLGRTFIDGNGRFLDERIINQHNGRLTIVGVTLQNGHEYDDADSGGAVLGEAAAPLTIKKSRVIDNYAYSEAGGLGVADGKLTVVKSIVNDNVAGEYGGGISSYDGGGDIVIQNSRVNGNVAGDGPGGILTGDGKLTLIRSQVNSNTGGSYGGGIDIYGNGARIKDSVISGNRQTYESYYGGGIYDEGNDDVVVIDGSTIADNYTNYYGGGIYAEYGTWKIRNTTITRNEASHLYDGDGYGGAVYNAGADMELRNVTVYRNYAYDVGGIFNSAGTLSMKNTIVARNRDFDDSEYTEDCYGGDVTSLGNNLIGDGSCAPVTSDLAGSSSDPLAPRLDSLAYNGGPTPTNALLPGSPAINKGKGCLRKDQRGKKRKGKCDIGAFER